ncbi:hypothetical protein CR513_04985, partial [Mucuna pruriens]
MGQRMDIRHAQGTRPLVSPPNDKSIIGTKWILRNNWTRMVRLCVIKQARLEFILILLSFAAHHNMRLHQMDFKCAFLNGIINEEDFVKQPPSFKSDIFPNHVFKLKETLYGLKQAPRAWFEKN